MTINRGDFARHLGVQVGAAAVTAGLAVMAGHNYSDLGAYGALVQSLAALATTAWNTFEKSEGWNI